MPFAATRSGSPRKQHPISSAFPNCSHGLTKGLLNGFTQDELVRLASLQTHLLMANVL